MTTPLPGRCKCGHDADSHAAVPLRDLNPFHRDKPGTIEATYGECRNPECPCGWYREDDNPGETTS